MSIKKIKKCNFFTKFSQNQHKGKKNKKNEYVLGNDDKSYDYDLGHIREK